MAVVKKILSAITAAAVILTLTACGAETAEPSAEQPNSSETTSASLDESSSAESTSVPEPEET
ncbi:MAG: hypothetical protein ACI4J8_00505, partial [Oscillospiraceae bacterium]